MFGGIFAKFPQFAVYPKFALALNVDQVTPLLVCQPVLPFIVHGAGLREAVSVVALDKPPSFLR
jgi:hypothetical protein